MIRRTKKVGPIGIDVGASGLRMLQLAEDQGQPAIVAAVHVEFPPGDEASNARDALIEQSVASALQKHPFIGRRVVAALSTGEYQIKNIRVPRMPEAEMTGAVEFEAQDRFEYPAGTAQFCFIPAGEVRHGNELKEEIVVFGAARDIIQKRLDLLSSLKLQPEAIDVAPCGVARGFMRFLRRAEDATAVHVFLDVGYSGTTVMITRGTNLCFVKSIDVGGKQFNTAVSQSLNIPFAEATQVRLRIIRESGGRNAAAGAVPEDLRHTVADAVRPSVERLGREVNLCLRYFSVTFRGTRPECFTLAGGEAHEPVILAILDEALDTPCTIGHPLRGMRRLESLGGHDRRTYQPAWAAVTGLALRGTQWVSSIGLPGGSMESGRQVAV